MKKTLFIYNALSGNRTTVQRLDYIIDRFQKKGFILQPFRLHKNCKDQIAKIISTDTFHNIVVSGGDGTVNFIANTMLKNNISLPLGIIPSGTCNDLACCIGIPSSLEKSIDIILKNNILSMDVGLINNEKYFLSTCAGGLFVDASYSVDNQLKRDFGPFAYYLKALSDLTNLTPFELKIEIPESTIIEKSLMFIILNGNQGGGFSNLIKEADIKDGLMDILVIKNCSHINLATKFFKVLSNDFKEDQDIIKIKTKSCKLTADRDIPMSVDGEKGEILPYNIEFISNILKVYVL